MVMNGHHRPWTQDWDMIDPILAAMHESGATGQEVLKEARRLGCTAHPQTIWLRLNAMGRFFREPRKREPWTPEVRKKKTAVRNKYETDSRRQQGHQRRVARLSAAQSDEKDHSRLCHRPQFAPHATLTGRLLGDPQPGRTPWA